MSFGNFSRLLRRSVATLIVVAAGSAGAAYWWANTPMQLGQPERDISITPGPLRAVAVQLRQNGVPMNPHGFELIARVLHLSTSLKSGNYAFETGITPYQVLLKVARGDVNQSSVTVIEGWNVAHMRAEINANPALRHDTAAMNDAQLMAALGAPDTAAEGMFFPDTYLFSKGASDLSVYRRAYAVAQQRLAQVWAARSPDLSLSSPYQALTLASLVEKETGKAVERGEVASVFLNRLKIGMPLQTDPSVIYGLGSGYGGRLTKKDLQTDTPYNTYTRRGLPPTPIALPGMAALKAATHPATSKALYFVARGDGTSVFSESLVDHNRAVNLYQRNLGVAGRAALRAAVPGVGDVDRAVEGAADAAPGAASAMASGPVGASNPGSVPVVAPSTGASAHDSTGSNTRHQRITVPGRS